MANESVPQRTAQIIPFPSRRQRCGKLPDERPLAERDPERFARLQAYAEMIRLARVEEDAGIRYPA